MTRKIVILTGDELRHRFFRKKLANYDGIEVLASYCEGDEASLAKRTLARAEATALEKWHVEGRERSELDFFGDLVALLPDHSSPRRIAKGAINDPDIVRSIAQLQPDLLVCYGSSLVRSSLLQSFEGRFLNVHLGLSPYYRGTGTNAWAMINGELHMVGATFMHIDAGIDTGRIIHQIRATIALGDGPHSIGNRLIRDMVAAYAEIISAFDTLAVMPQPIAKGRLYLVKDFDGYACERLYRNFRDGMIERHLAEGAPAGTVPIVTNPSLCPVP